MTNAEIKKAFEAAEDRMHRLGQFTDLLRRFVECGEAMTAAHDDDKMADSPAGQAWRMMATLCREAYHYGITTE